MRKKSVPVECQIMTYLGQQDGIRFGELSFKPGGSRQFRLDRLTGKVRLWQTLRNGKGREISDEHTPRITAAIKEFKKREPFPNA